MRRVILLTVFLTVLGVSFAPPVTQNKGKETNETEDDIGGLADYMEYHRYLREVVSALESDPQFREKLEKADEGEIRSGKIANELEFVSHHVRTRLDEIKRVELNRLKELMVKKRRLQENIDMEDPMHHHLDHSNPHTFEIDDLKKLIAKTTEDLAEADRKRREEFKEYELQKEYEKQMKLNTTLGEEREKLEKEFKAKEEKHKKHEKLHEPGHKAQLEEVWQEQDQMQQDFDPKTFFMLHDLDSNGLWDEDEVKALFVKELEKMYAAGEPEDDMRERAEEMERMRETVFKEVDLNHDKFIDFSEFLAQTKRNEFQQDHGWQGLDERKVYSDQELDEYIRAHQANQVPHGYPPPPPGYHPNAIPVHPNGAPVHPQYPVPPQPYYQEQQYYGGPPQGYQGHVQNPQGHPQAYQQHPQGNVGQGYQGQPVPQQQQYQGQVPQQQQYQGQVPQQQQYQGQVPPHQPQAQVPPQKPQGQVVQGQVPQQQQYQGQVPQQQPPKPGQVPAQHPPKQEQVPVQQPQGQVPQQQQQVQSAQQPQVPKVQIPNEDINLNKVK